MDRTRLVVIGGGYSGVIAARRLALRTKGMPVDITMITASDSFAERIRFHQVASGQAVKRVPMPQMLKGRDVRLVLGKVTRIGLAEHSVTVETGQGEQTLGYDKLVYALGSLIDATRVPGAAAHAVSLNAYDLAQRWGSALPTLAQTHGRVVICGGGLTGIESASEIAESYPGLDVSLITRGAFGADLSEAGQKHLRRVFDRLGIHVLDNTAITRVEEDRVEYAGGSIGFDLCLWAGAFGVPALAREAGLAVNGLGQIITDDHLRSVSHPEVYAVGDAAGISEAIDTPIRMGCATAYPMGSYAADDIAAGLRAGMHEPYEFAYRFRCISLGRHDGLIQMVDADDRPRDSIITGQAGVWFKEMICRLALWMVRNDQISAASKRPSGKRRAAGEPLAVSAQSH